MLFNLLTSFIDQYSFLNVFKYLTFRTGLSVVTSLVVVFIIGGPLIKLFSENMITGPIRQDGPIDHIIKKNGHPYNGRCNNNHWNYFKHTFMGRFKQHICLDLNLRLIITRCIRVIR